jgi:hypothetical protein
MTEHPDKTRRKRLARGGLAQMMREDPRYFDGNAPEHPGMVNMVTRGFEMLAEEDDDTTPGSRLAGAYERMITDKKTIDLLEGTWLEKSGRTMMLAALDDHGIDFPSGIKEEAMALRKLYPKRAPQQIAPDTLQAPTTLLPPGTILSESQRVDGEQESADAYEDREDQDREEEQARRDEASGIVVEIIDAWDEAKDKWSSFEAWWEKHMSVTDFDKLPVEAQQLILQGVHDGVGSNVPSTGGGKGGGK